MSVPFASRIGDAKDAESRSLGPLGVAEVVYEALQGSRPQRLLITPGDSEELFLVRVVERSVLALNEAAEEDLALELLRDGVISVDGLMRARRRAARDHTTLVEGLLGERVVSPQMMSEHARASTKVVMEELFALKEATYYLMPESGPSASQVYLNVQPDSFIVDFVRRSVTPLRARKVLGEIGDRFVLAPDASARLGVCGLLGSEREALENFQEGAALEDHINHRDVSYAQVAAQAIFSAIVIGLLVPESDAAGAESDQPDLWEDFEVGPAEDRDTGETLLPKAKKDTPEEPAPSPAESGRAGGYSVPAISAFKTPVESVPPPADDEPVPVAPPEAAASAAAANGKDAIADADFAELVAALQEDGFDSHRLKLLRKIAPNRRFTVAQLIEIFDTMDFDSPGRAEAAAAVYPRLVDPENFEEVYDHLTHNPNRKVIERRIADLKIEMPEPEPASEPAFEPTFEPASEPASELPANGKDERSEEETDLLAALEKNVKVRGNLPDAPVAWQEDTAGDEGEATPPSMEGRVIDLNTGAGARPQPPQVDEVHLLEDVVRPGPGFLPARPTEEIRPVVKPTDAPKENAVTMPPVRTPKPTPRSSPIPTAPAPSPAVPSPPDPDAVRRSQWLWAFGGALIVLLSVSVGYGIGVLRMISNQPTATPTLIAVTQTPTPAPSETATPATPEPTRAIVVATPKPTPKPLTPEQRAKQEAYRHWSTGRAHHKAGRLADAVDELEKAIELDPRNAKFHAHLALALYDLDDLGRAEQSARAAVRLNPREPWGHLALGNVHQAAGRTDQAIASYERYLALKPTGQMSVEVRQIVDMLKMQ